MGDFKIYMYRESGDLIWDQDFRITGIRRGEIISFSEILTGVEIKEIDKYAIILRKDKVDRSKLVSLNPDSQKDAETDRVEEEKKSVRQVEDEGESTKDEADGNSEAVEQVSSPKEENEKSVTVEDVRHVIEEFKPEQTAVLTENTLNEKKTLASEGTNLETKNEDTVIEGLKDKDIGGGLYVNDMIITPIKSGVKVSGLLRNISEEPHGLAMFSVKFLDKENKLIQKHDIIITGIEARSTVEFSEIFSWVSHEEIDSFEIVFAND